MNGYLGAGLVGSVNLNTTGQFEKMNLSALTNVDKIEIVSSGASQWWLMDDLSYTVVPEPGTMALFGLGLGFAAFGAVRRRKKN